MSFIPEGTKPSDQAQALGAAIKKILSGYLDIPDDAMSVSEWTDAGAEAIAEANLTLNKPKIVRDDSMNYRGVDASIANALGENLVEDLMEYARTGRVGRRGRRYSRHDSLYGDPFDAWYTSPRYLGRGI